MPDREWLRGSDAQVTEELTRVLDRARQGPSHSILGLRADASAEDVRAAFLDAVKSYHPARFARRPLPVQRLANEAFLAIKLAQEHLSKAARGRRAAGTTSPPPPAATADPLVATADSPAAPYRDDPRFVEASQRCDRGDYAAAKELFGELCREMPDVRAVRAHYYYASSGVLLDAGRGRQALSELKRSLAADSSFAPARRALARLMSGELRARSGE